MPETGGRALLDRPRSSIDSDQRCPVSSSIGNLINASCRSEMLVRLLWSQLRRKQCSHRPHSEHAMPLQNVAGAPVPRLSYAPRAADQLVPVPACHSAAAAASAGRRSSVRARRGSIGSTSNGKSPSVKSRCLSCSGLPVADPVKQQCRPSQLRPAISNHSSVS